MVLVRQVTMSPLSLIYLRQLVPSVKKRIISQGALWGSVSFKGQACVGRSLTDASHVLVSTLLARPNVGIFNPSRSCRDKDDEENLHS